MPSAGDEEWRRTDIRAFKLEQFSPPAVNGSRVIRTGIESVRAAVDPGAGCAGRTATVDGQLGSHEITEKAAGQGVLFLPLERAVREHPELVERHFLTRAVRADYDKFSALHAAFWTGGTLLYVPKNVSVEEPLSSLVGLSGEGQTDLSHLLVVMDEGSSATLVHEYVSPARGRPGLHVGAVEVFVGRGAQLRLVSVQNWATDVWHFSHQRALVGRDASFEWTIAGLGSRLAKVNQEVVLEAAGASAEMNGVMFTGGNQHLSYHTRQLHAAERCWSDLLYRGVLKDRSRIVWRGMIRVEPGAQKTDAYQKNDNLVLAPTARADSIPGLEIEADDVRCTHGATAGRVDDEQVFYAMCRGLTRPQAVRMIVEGFFQGVYDRVSVEPIREALARTVAAKVED